MKKEAKAFLQRLQALSAQTRDLSHVADWVSEYTMSPKDSTTPWSFKDHEYQKAILNERRPYVEVRKCSQVGLSEIQVRMMLAMLHLFPGSTAIYTLPTTSFARQFTRTRVDPVIDASPLLKTMVPSNNDSSELKQIGHSFLYVRGSFGQKAAISVPADFLFQDEVDFSDQGVLSTFNSRLGHAEDGGIRRRFSTPTVSGYGISLGFERTTKNWYMVRCQTCEDWVRPLFLEDAVLPGWDDTLLKLEKEDVTDSRYRFEKAFIRCPACGAKLTQENLADPERRQWVAEHPDAEIAGYQVQPFDVPRYNTPAKTLTSLLDYRRKADWVNFEMGMPYEDAETSFVKDTMKANTTIQPVLPLPKAAHGCVLGMDIGKTSHIIIGKRVSDLEMRLLYAEKIRQTSDDSLYHRALELADMYGVIKGVVDAGPDFSTVMKLISSTWLHRFFACYYVKKAKTPLADLDVKDEEQVLNAGRTDTFDRAAKLVNSGRVKFAMHAEFDEVKQHLGNLKRVSTVTSTGDTVYSWVKTDGPDHYAHALNYLLIADSLCTHDFKNIALPVLPMTGRVKIKTLSDRAVILPYG
jgi:hypothetical protein